MTGPDGPVAGAVVRDGVGCASEPSDTLGSLGRAVAVAGRYRIVVVRDDPGGGDRKVVRESGLVEIRAGETVEIDLR